MVLWLKRCSNNNKICLHHVTSPIPPAVVDRHTGVGSFHGNHTTKLVLISVGPGRGGGGELGYVLSPVEGCPHYSAHATLFSVIVFTVLWLLPWFDLMTFPWYPDTHIWSGWFCFLNMWFQAQISLSFMGTANQVSDPARNTAHHSTSTLLSPLSLSFALR